MRRGIIDLMGVVELLTFIQDEFAIDVDGDEITEENLGTLDAIASLVLAKRRDTVAV